MDHVPRLPHLHEEGRERRAGRREKKVNWKAQVFWSHREWEATILDQRPDERIIWRSKGQKGHVDGAVTFHELAPSLTKIVLVLEYHPQGMFEQTGNLWRAQGRRARLELKHFQRHVMAHALLNPDDVEGWRGVIEDGEVVKDHETVLDEEARERGEEPADSAEAGRGRGRRDETEPEDEHRTRNSRTRKTRKSAPPTRTPDADGDRPGGRRRAPARGGSRGARPQRTRQGAARGGARDAPPRGAARANERSDGRN